MTSPVVPQPAPREATLHGYGPQPWSFVLDLATNLVCSWADNSGFHIGPCPGEAPPYSHLWGWNADGSVLLRVRIDGDRGVPAVLTKAAGTAPEAGGSTQTVRVTVRQALPWPKGEKRIKVQQPGVLEGRIDLIQVLGTMPMTFVHHPRTGHNDA